MPGDLIQIIDNTLYVNDQKINNIKTKKQLFNIREKNVFLTIYKEKNNKNKTYDIYGKEIILIYSGSINLVKSGCMNIK